MRYYIAVQSTNDIITNSSTEILSLLAPYTADTLKELLLNYACRYDASENPDSENIEVWKIDVREMATDLFGEVSEEELEMLEIILCKRLEIDYLKWSGELYRIEIDRDLDNTIKYIETKLGGV